MEQGTQVLVVDDDPEIRELITDYLSGHGYRVTGADCADALRVALATQRPDVVLLDIGLPGEDGLSLARYLREHHDLAVIVVSGAGELVDRIIGLEVGADDYLTKPFDPRELLARIRSVLRRYQRRPAADTPAALPGDSSRRMAFGQCVLDLDSRELLGPQGEPVPLTAAEFDLLQVFAERPNRTLSRDQLLGLTQHREWDPYDRSIDIRIARLRKKIEANPDKPRTIKTVRGVGYQFVPGKA
jgi:two-component system, OmpR family, phosphate regulon response regulator OmpR